MIQRLAQTLLRSRTKVALGVVRAALLVVRASFVCDSLMFLPMAGPTPAPAGLQDVSFATSDGVNLHGWFAPALGADGRSIPGPAPAVLQIHGNGGTIEGAFQQSHFLQRQGISVLTFDFRSYGQSDQTLMPLTRNAVMQDVEAAWKELRSLPGVDPTRTGVFAHSIGNTFALHLAGEHPECRAIVSISPFTSWKEVASVHVRILPWLVLRSGLDPIDEVAGLAQRPMLVVHGDNDRVVPFEHGKRVHAAAIRAGARAEFLGLKGVGHNDILLDDAATQAHIGQFLRSALNPTEAAQPKPR